MKKLLVLLFLLPLLFIGSNVSAANDYVRDNANELSSTEESNLESQIINVYNETEVEIFILTFDSLPGYGAYGRKDAADQHMNELYPTSNPPVVVIVINTDIYDRGIEIRAYGLAEDYISDQEAYNMTGGNVLTNLTNGNYYNALTELVDLLEEEILSSKLFKAILPHIIIAVSAIVVAIIVLTSVIFSRGGSRTVSGATYIDRSKARVLGSYDRYMRTTVSKTPRSSNSSGGSSGGGRSSSGGGRSF